jgi:hypothetical protein
MASVAPHDEYGVPDDDHDDDDVPYDDEYVPPDDEYGAGNVVLDDHDWHDAWQQEYAATLASLELKQLELKQLLDDRDREVRALKCQLESLRALMRQLQDDMLFSATPSCITAASPEAVGTMATPLPDSPLLMAASKGDAPMVELLLSEGADAREHGDAAILLACQGGHVDVARLLVDDGGARVDVDLGSPLLWAVRLGNRALAEVLLERGADPECLGGLPLRMATRKSDVEMARVLLGARGRGAPL